MGGASQSVSRGGGVTGDPANHLSPHSWELVEVAEGLRERLGVGHEVADGDGVSLEVASDNEK